MKKFIKEFLACFKTSFIRNSATNKEWDKKLNEMIDDENIVDLFFFKEEPYYVTFSSGVNVWVQNKYYAYGSEWDGFPAQKELPYRTTQLKLNAKVNEFLKNYKKG